MPPAFLSWRFLVEIVVNLILKILVAHVAFFKLFVPSVGPLKLVSKLLGIIPGLCSGFRFVGFCFEHHYRFCRSLCFLKQSILSSKIGNVLVGSTQGFSKDWNNIFGGAVNDTLSFLTVEPQSNETINLNFKTTAVSVDKNAESLMLQMVNGERTTRGITALSFRKA